MKCIKNCDNQDTWSPKHSSVHIHINHSWGHLSNKKIFCDPKHLNVLCNNLTVWYRWLVLSWYRHVPNVCLLLWSLQMPFVSRHYWWKIKKLQVLAISYNQIGNEGVAAICQGLKNTTTLTELEMYQCGLSVEGMYYIIM